LTCAEVVTLLKDIILAGAAITGSIVAIKGLGTWQRQQKWQAEYELSRRILVAVFKFRDAINGARHPAIWANEQPSPSEDAAKKMNTQQLQYYGLSKAYQARWDKVQAERISLYPDLLEAEALWGNELNDLFKVLFNLEHELLVAIRHYLELSNPDTRESKREAIMNLDKKRRDIMYDDLSDDIDEFKKDLLAGIQSIEKYLKPKLKHEKV